MITQQYYSEYIWNVFNPTIRDNKEINKDYLLLKLISETGELLGELCKEKYHGKTDLRAKFLDELSDMLWYIVNLNNIFNIETSFDNLAKTQPSDCIYYAISIIESATDFRYYLGEYQRIKYIIYSFYNLVLNLGFSIQEVINYNYNKLKARHGDAYNKEFYVSKESV